MLYQTNIIYIGIGFIGFRHYYGVFPETKIINTIITFRNREKRFSIQSLYPRGQ